MVKEIIRDEEILQKVSAKVAKPQSKEVAQLIKDLVDTAKEHRDRCVGLSAIQIGEPVRVFVVFDGERFVSFINPIAVGYFGEVYEAEESCMSLDGTRKAKRHRGIELMYQSGNKFVRKAYKGFMAQIIQHELDHLSGKLI